MSSAVSRALHLLGRPQPPYDKDALSRTPSPGSLSDQRDSHVRERLHALFTSQPPVSPPSPAPTPFKDPTETFHERDRDIRIDTAHIGPDVGLSPVQDSELTSSRLIMMEPGNMTRGDVGAKDRQAIKIFVVTWNMGDALPKGDLSVLFGNVPKYDEASRSEGLPELPMIDTHPYHIVVVAGQECPTISGIHRGIGGGLMKGMSVRHGKHRHSKDDRENADENLGQKDAKELGLPMEEGFEGTSSGSRSPAVHSDMELTDDGGSTRATTPVPPPSGAATPTGTSSTVPPPHPHVHKHHPKEPKEKGWSQMLDEWFCGPAATDLKPPTGPNSPLTRATSPLIQPIMPVLNLAIPSSVNVARPSPAPTPASPSATSTPIPVPSAHHPVHPIPLLGRSNSTASSLSSISSTSSLDSPIPPNSPQDMLNSSSPPVPPNLSSIDKPEIVEPNPDPRHAESRGGCYSHVLKERLMGMYLTVYVYRGCEHLVQGVDKDYVTAGLARGRVGNKGGIGIALKLAGRSFLFVNSHLAAHKHRVNARLDNIAKIKSELHINDFLPRDDPRKAAGDITDRFDTVFWMGDLNFRLDMSRLHAEWLVEQKNYKELLSWDQLRAVMRDPENNPFTGFEEGPIDFAPTFKYDVWRSLKHTQKELKKSSRQRSGTQSSVRTETGAKALGTSLVENGLTGLAETHEEDAASSGEETQQSEYRPIQRSVSNSRSIRSVRSARSGPTDDGQDDELDEAPKIDASAYGSRHKALEVAIKAKTKQFLTRVRLDGLLGSSPTTRSSKRKGSQPSLQRADSSHSRRESFTSTRSIVSTRNGAQQVSTPSDDQHGDNFALSASPPIASSSTGSQPPSSPSRPRHTRTASMKSFIAIKRTVSGRSAREEEEEEVEEGFTLDQREGVYDSSKKQRVPSWCDRVLWKTRIVEELATVDAEDTSVPQQSPRRLSRIIARLSPTSETKTLLHRDRSEDRSAAPDSLVRGESPEATPRPGLVSLTSVDSATSHSNPRRRQSHPPRMTSTGSLHSQLSPPELNVEPAVMQDFSLSDRRDLSRGNDSRARSGSFSPITRDPRMPLPSIHTQPVRRHSTLDVDRSSPRKPNGVPLGSRSMTLDQQADEHQSRLSMRSLRASIGGGNLGAADNSFKRFFRDLPTILHVRQASAAVPDDETEGVPEIKQQKPKHKQGEVVCLHYGTIDDGGMRQLEGRSDHRPARFSAAVYI